MSSVYFNTLNYSLANEDTALELGILPESRQHVLSVAGSGSRVLPLFAKNPRLVTCVDLSQEQLFLTELRVESARMLTREQFLGFWGYPPVTVAPDERKRILEELTLSDPCREFFRGMFESLGWQSVLYQGRWEKTFFKISRFCRAVLGGAAQDIFSATTKAQHDDFMLREFPTFRWNLLVFLIGNSSFFNALLYKGHFPKKNTPGSHRQFYKDAYDRIFAQGLPRENYFLQLTLLGDIAYPEGNPVECQPGIFERIQTGIRQCKIRYQLANVVEHVSQLSADPVDFVSISDVPSYFDDALASEFLTRMSKGLNPGALVVARYYLRVIQETNMSGFQQVTEKYRSLIDAEKTQMYHVEVYKKDSVEGGGTRQ
ncbi:MAG: hypothetical protein RI953_1735 [Pseudomonadota bacterium]|jgi:S-adenosylmethionine-diacylglycerol 3-amino-3-carboxypropyl transferase